ncbi:outer membrane beta-barrel protein [Pedobacter sp. GR22-6]|uniref:outer membrane beta-barrel protein n=1 Tax=Pedobacter sp. GR22-6 TaxID=3127957 RepID=UPI00307E3F00
MQPTNHMNPAEDEFIAHVRQSLSDHEEEYVPGAWEKFNKKEKKSQVVWLWSLSTAAAVLIVCALVFLREGKNTPEPGVKFNSTADFGSVKKETKKQEPGTELRMSDNTVVVGQQVEGGTVVPVNGYKNINSSEGLAAANIPSVTNTNLKPNIQDLAGNKVPDDRASVEKGEIPAEKEKMSFEEFLEKESASNAIVKTSTKQKEDKWEMGLMLAPSMGNNKKLNMGYGLSMAYALSDKVAIGSGLAYNEMGAARDNAAPEAMPNAPSSMTALASSSKQLQSVQTRVRGVDIPLELRYKFSPKLYANAGISVFAVFKQEQQNTFLQSSVESAASAGLLNQDKDAFRQVLVNRLVSEEAPKEELKSDPYLGFYNFSIGFKQKVSKKSAIAIEPFLKVPMKETTNENLRLIGTGVKLKFDF